MLLSQDFRSPNGVLQVHLSVKDDNCCYIYVLNCIDQNLTMRFFSDIVTATDWIRTNLDPNTLI